MPDRTTMPRIPGPRPDLAFNAIAALIVSSAAISSAAIALRTITPKNRKRP